MARIAGFHPAGPGSIPGVGELIFFFFLKSNQEKKVKSIWFDLIKLTICIHFFDVSTKLYDVLNILTSY